MYLPLLVRSQLTITSGICDFVTVKGKDTEIFILLLQRREMLGRYNNVESCTLYTCVFNV